MALATIFNDDFFGPAFRQLTTPSGDRSLGNLPRGIPLDVKETDKAFAVKADIPGVDKNDIKVTVDGDVLSIAVQKEAGKQEDKEEEGVKWHRTERSTFFASRALRLPDSADLSNIKAKYDNGVLQLEIPKQEKAERTKAINVE